MTKLLSSIAEKVLSCSSASSIPLYFVGGVVRDYLMMGKQYHPVDIDILVDGDLEPLLEECEVALQGKTKKHERFLTAKIESANYEVDFVRARKEIYERPGALPTVFPGTFESDIQRRDFTLNALAIPLDKIIASDAIILTDIIDICGGLADLQNRTLRIFHAKSFEDDPTRIIRAARYAGRYRYSLEPKTEEILRGSINKGVINTVTKSRVFHELERVAREQQLSAVGHCLKDWGATPFLPTIMWGELNAIQVQCDEDVEFSDIFFASILFASESELQFFKDAGVSKKRIQAWQKLIEDSFRPQEFKNVARESLFLASAINPKTPWREELERRDSN